MPTPNPVVTTLADACDLAVDYDAPALVGLVLDGDHLVVEDGPVFGHLDDLIGYVAPARWDAITLVCTGRAHHLDGGPPFPIRFALALDRTGRFASVVTTPDSSFRHGDPDPLPSGHAVDVCHRILEMSAPPEPSRPADLLAALDPDTPVADLAPATWDDAYQAIVAIGRGWGDFSPADVEWMDAPTWARYVLDAAPSLTLSLIDVRHPLSTSTTPPVLDVLTGSADSVRR